jgi:YgiT-type zinc finger domain-containing protein
MKKCNFCGHTNLREDRVQYLYKHDDRFLLVNDVPCEECSFCGEQYFKAGVLKKIEKDFHAIYETGKKTKKNIRVPVENFSSI